MKLEPQTFFIGIIDFFAVMLPGATVVYLAKVDIGPRLFNEVFPPYTTPTEGWAIFLFASYFIGHFIFLLGSKLDDWVYDPIRRATPGAQLRRIAKGDSEAHPWVKALAKGMFRNNPDVAVERISHLKALDVPDRDSEPAINAFQWAKARLTLQCPAGLLEVQRIEADSKFFRSLVVVLLVVPLWATVRPALQSLPINPPWAFLLTCLIFAIFSLLRYVERRFKATQQAYWYILSLQHCQPGRTAKASD